MTTINFRMTAMLAGVAMFAFASVADAAQGRNPGASRAGAKSSVNRGGGGGGGGKYAGGGGGGGNRGGGNNNVNINKKNNVNVNTAGRNGYNNRGNTVVVAPGRGGGYNNNNGWDNDDNDFLEFVGKTAAITAGVSVVAAVIGSTTNDKPDDCQQSVSNGQVYMNCNGTWYQPIQNGSQTQYQVIAPPR